MTPAGLKVLMISGDRNLARPGSAVARRLAEYGEKVGELHIVLMSDASHGLKEVEISKNTWVYPTNSSVHFLRPLGAASLGKKLVVEKGFIRGNSLITADSIEAGWAGLQIKKKWRLPLEVQVHTNPFSPFYAGFQNSVRKFFARQVFAHADALRVVSEEVKREVSQLTKAPISVLPIYVEREQIENAPVTFDVHARYPWHFVILAVSRLAPEKDLSTAIHALAILRKESPDAGLLIVGSGSEEGHLKSLVKSLGLTGGVEFAGWQDELASFYKTANAFIQCSLFEGYGLSLIEAGLSGLPIVSTPVGIAAEFEDNKEIYLCASGRPDLFAAALTDLMARNEKRESLRFNMKKALEQKLLSKEKYLEALVSQWGKIAHFSA